MFDMVEVRARAEVENVRSVCDVDAVNKALGVRSKCFLNLFS